MVSAQFISLMETELIHAVADINDEFHQSQQEQDMSLTGASYLTTSIHDLIAKAKGRVADAHNKIGEAVDNLGSAASAAEGIASAINAEADDLLSGLAQFTNGAPANPAPEPPVVKKTPLPAAPTLIPTEPPLPTPAPAVAPAVATAVSAEPKKNEGSV